MKLYNYYNKGTLWWFRFGVSGLGLHAKKLLEHPRYFSERYGYVITFTYNGWQYKLLNRMKNKRKCDCWLDVGECFCEILKEEKE